MAGITDSTFLQLYGDGCILCTAQKRRLSDLEALKLGMVRSGI